MKLLGITLLLALAAPANAQSFNIDVGENLIIFPEPAATYGGAASQTGAWNKSIHPYSTALVNLDGSASSVTTTSDQNGWYNYFPSTLTGDDRNLMIDIQSFGDSITLVTSTWTFSGLQNGSYIVYTYAWDPQNNGTATLVTVPGSSDAPQSIGGLWAGSPHVLGTTYALHHAIASNGTLTVLANNSQGHAGSINAFQIVFLGGAMTTYCSGDGTGTACPCANSGTASNGCANSLNALGAHLGTLGNPSVASDTLVLVGSGMPDSSALYFQGTSQSGAGAGAAFGDGLRCVAGTIVRLGTKTNVGGTSSYPVGGDSSVSVHGGVAAGNVRNYQVWYRNAAAFCTASTFNLSNGVQVTWQP